MSSLPATTYGFGDVDDWWGNSETLCWFGLLIELVVRWAPTSLFRSSLAARNGTGEAWGPLGWESSMLSMSCHIWNIHHNALEDVRYWLPECRRSGGLNIETRNRHRDLLFLLRSLFTSRSALALRCTVIILHFHPKCRNNNLTWIQDFSSR